MAQIGLSRIPFIDTAKGLCIMLVVLYHINTYYDIPEIGIVASFHMPLFFLLSGCFYKSYGSFKLFCTKKTNQLLIPFFFFYLTISVALPNLLSVFGYSVRNENGIGIRSLLNFIVDNNWPNSPIWFLLCLYMINLLFYFFEHISRGDKRIIACLSVICGIVGYVLSYLSLNIYMYIDSALTGLFFFWLGNMMYTQTSLVKSKQKIISLLFVILVGLLCIVFWGHDIGWSGNNGLASYPLYEVYITAILGSFSLIAFSKLFYRWLPCFTYWGKYSLIILCTHNSILQVLNIITTKFQLSVWLSVVLILVVTMMLYYFIVPLLIRIIPWFVNQKHLLKEK
jgi:fucose 4-O-acetylase-like acetyltransferase